MANGLTGLLSNEGITPVGVEGGSGLGLIPSLSKGISFGVNRAIGGKDVDRNIDIPAFNLGSAPTGTVLEAYAALGASDPIIARALNLPEFSSFANLFKPRYDLIMSAANNVLTALKDLGLAEQAQVLSSAIAVANNENIPGDATLAIKARFQSLQDLWNASVKSEAGIQELLGGLSEQERTAFNNNRNQGAANELLPLFEAQLAKNTSALNTQQFTQSGDPVVNVLSGGQEVTRIASQEKAEDLSPDEKIQSESLSSLSQWIDKLKSIGSNVTQAAKTGLSLNLASSGGSRTGLFGSSGGTTMVLRQPQQEQNQLITTAQGVATPVVRPEKQDFNRDLILFPKISRGLL